MPRTLTSHQQFGTGHGGLAKLDAERTRVAALSDKERAKFNEKYTAAHHGSVFDHEPLLPFHHVVFDPMHGIHNEANVLLDEAIHQQLIVESPDKEVQAQLASTQAAVNKLWSGAALPKFIQFGKDDKGSHSHALNGPAFKAVWDNAPLLIETFKLMEPVWEMNEARKATPAIDDEVAQMLADDHIPAPNGPKKGATQASGQKGRKRKHRGVNGCEIEHEVSPTHAQTQPRVLQNHQNEEGSNQRTQNSTQDSTTSTPNTDNVRVQVGDLTFKQRVAGAFVAFIAFYDHLHGGHGIKASSLSAEARKIKAKDAVALAIEMQRAMLALIGTHRRRTYAHDFVYGLHSIYTLYGKPWNAATEGNEHAHQEMKKYFLHLTCHSNKKEGDCLQVLKLMLVKRRLLEKYSGVLPHSNYAAMRCGQILAKEAVTNGKKRGAASGPKGEKNYSDEPHAKMQKTADAIRAFSLVGCSSGCAC